jgi:phage gp36-like protein
MFTTKAELKTHMDVDNIDIITNNDNTIVEAAIDGATQEAKGYLNDFDTNSIFSAVESARNTLLLTFVKDIAVWHLMVLSNYKADVEFRKTRYERAVAWLRSVMKGDVVPDLPVRTVTDETPGKITFGSNQKRNNHF